MKNLVLLLGLLSTVTVRADNGAHSVAAGPSVTVGRVAGVPRLHIDGKPCSGMAVMPSPKAAPGTSVETLKEYARRGVRFSSDVWTMNDPRYVLKQWWLGEGQYDFALFDALAHGLLDASADGMIFPRIKIDPPKSWQEAHPDEMFEGKVRPDSKAWRALYRGMLKDMIAHVERSDYAGRVMGYHIGALHCGEWLFYPFKSDHVFPSVVGDGRDPLPPLDATEARRRRASEISDAVAEATIDACAWVRELTEGRKVVGSFSGYVWFSHEAVHRILSSGKVDFVAAPPFYEAARDVGHAGVSQSPYMASMRLHNVVFYEETDFRTFLSDPAAAPAGMTRRRPLDEAVSLLQRSVGRCLTTGCENWWFLLGGNASFSHPELMSVIRRGAELSCESLERAQWRPAEVAVFTSAREYATTRISPANELIENCKEGLLRDILPHCGVPYDAYELADIEHADLPDYRVYVFPNAFTLTESQCAAIRARVRRAGKTAVWIYAPGYYRNGAGSVANVQELTGVSVRERYPVEGKGPSRVIEPTGLATVVQEGARSVFLPNPVDAEGFRRVFREAGAHVWIDTPDVLTAGRGFVMLHASTDGKKEIRLPASSAVEEVFGRVPKSSSARVICEELRRGETRVYRLKPVGETGPIRVACIGDSITYGTAMTNRTVACYPVVLQKWLGPGYEVRNFGDPGAGIYEHTWRGKRPRAWRLRDEYARALAFRPDIIVSNLGINDAGEFIGEFASGEGAIVRGTFREEYVALLESFRRDGKLPRIIMWSRLSPMSKNHEFKGKPNAAMMEGDLAEVARRVDAETLDMLTPLLPFAETDDYAADGVHPLERPQRVIAELTAKAILSKKSSRK